MILNCQEGFLQWLSKRLWIYDNKGILCRQSLVAKFMSGSIFLKLEDTIPEDVLNNTS